MLFRLLVTLQKNKHHIAFLLSVILSLTFIYYSPSSEYSYFQHNVNSITNYIKAPFTRFSELSKARLENEMLREQLLLKTLEKETLVAQGVENIKLKEMLEFRETQELSIIAAKIINKGLTTSINTVTVDIGSLNGVKINDPVITPNGVIGKIYSVESGTAVVHLINDPDFRIGVRFLPSAETGILRWKANNICEVREVYKNSEINVGDSVITSGLGDIFPPGLPIGSVTSVADTRDEFQKIISVKIKENLNALYYLFVIID